MILAVLLALLSVDDEDEQKLSASLQIDGRRMTNPNSPRRHRDEYRMSIDKAGKRVLIEWLGEFKGRNASLLIALAEAFLEALVLHKAPENYPFIPTPELSKRINCRSVESFRRIVYRCRELIRDRAGAAGDNDPSIDAIIETKPGRGYRLNPNLVRLVALSEIRNEHNRPGSPH
jgi:hypothetical protein